MEGEEQEKDAVGFPQENRKNHLRNCQRWLPLWIIFVLLGGAGAITWYFLDYRPRHLLESSPLHFYSGSLRILNRQYSLDHGWMESRTFWAETRKTQRMLKDLIHATDLSPYYNSSAVYAFGEGSLACFFWFALQVPTNQCDKMTAEKVKATLHAELLTTFNKTGHMSYQTEYQVDPKSLSVKIVLNSAPVFWSVSYPSQFCGRAFKLLFQHYLFLKIRFPLQFWILSLKFGLKSCTVVLTWKLGVAPTSLTSGSLHLQPSMTPKTSLLTSATVFKYFFLLSIQPIVVIKLKMKIKSQNVFRQNNENGNSQKHLHAHCILKYTSCKYTKDFLEAEVAIVRQSPSLRFLAVQDQRLCGLRTLQAYAERIPVVSSAGVTINFTSQITLTGPGVQAAYSLYNQSNPCPREFLCSVNGLCVPACDGIEDCPNGLDERNCVCPGKFQCQEDSTCIEFSKVCDKHLDCANGSDEEQCNEGVPCGLFTYQCADGSCVKKPNPQCDSVPDCKDRSDEMHCECGEQEVPTNRILGGTHSAEGEWPWQASLQVRGHHVCGGTLIADRWVIAAAHCFQEDSQASPTVWTIYLGKQFLNVSSPNEVSFKVSRILQHPYYEEDSHDYDVALLQLDHPVIYSAFIRPICLPAGSHLFEPGLLCWISGWGAVKEGGHTSKILQKADVQLVQQDICNEAYHYQVTPRMLCAGYQDGNKDSCQGDSGGPLACQEVSGKWFLAGVVSWGIGCGRPNHYGVYTRITSVMGWMKQAMLS
uniref:Transmembrane serine protease 6 n=1 Tax=Anolis carolinensis TaxID=28377 RepID=G1KS78_ANOCA